MTTKIKEIISDDKTNFVNLKEIIPNIIVELRYFTDYNFIGKKVSGYENNIAYVTKECAQALKEVEEEVKKKDYTIKIYDAYRPNMATKHFLRWSKEKEDVKTKEIFYKDIDKKELFEKGYISKKSSHSRGSTVDLTLYSQITKEDIDTGGGFDNFGPIAHFKYGGITHKQKLNRKYLREVMVKHGFIPLENEWWHFTLKNEPYPNTYFNFKIK